MSQFLYPEFISVLPKKTGDQQKMPTGPVGLHGASQTKLDSENSLETIETKELLALQQLEVRAGVNLINNILKNWQKCD